MPLGGRRVGAVNLPLANRTGNHITVQGSGAGIHVEGPLPQSIVIRNNTIAVESGRGMVIVTPAKDGSTISGNTLSATGSPMGIFVASPRTPNSGSHVISHNTIRGFATPISIDLDKHPGTHVSSD